MRSSSLGRVFFVATLLTAIFGVHHAVMGCSEPIKSEKRAVHSAGPTARLTLFTVSELNNLLLCAAEIGDEAAVRDILADDRVDVDTRGGDLHYSWGSSPLHLASWYGYEAIVAILIAAHANVNARSGFFEKKFTPLHMAASRGHGTIVKMLLAAGAEPSAQDTEGHTALDVADRSGHGEMVREAVRERVAVAVNNAILVMPSSVSGIIAQYVVGAPRRQVPAVVTYMGGLSALALSGSR